MSKDPKNQEARIDQFFSGPGARADNWRDLVNSAKVWAKNPGDRARFDKQLAQLSVTEEYHGYPGPHLMAALQEIAARRSELHRRVEVAVGEPSHEIAGLEFLHRGADFDHFAEALMAEQ